mgnify:CR=1 FL=1|tara:strand:+ start:104 stop:304 length:201 start_codon:yes stop_codon:yes gene_type:complete
MGCENVEIVLELPRAMNEEEFCHWESVNRPENMILLKEYHPVGEEPAELWRAIYLECDPVSASMLL